jgi:hypothetical protein
MARFDIHAVIIALMGHNLLIISTVALKAGSHFSLEALALYFANKFNSLYNDTFYEQKELAAVSLYD